MPIAMEFIIIHTYLHTKLLFSFLISLDSTAGSYLFVSHTGFGGVAYAMAIICIRLEAEAALSSRLSRSIGSTCSSELWEEHSNSDDEARKLGDYRDILSLIRVLAHGPESKSDIDTVVDRYDLYLLT